MRCEDKLQNIFTYLDQCTESIEQQVNIWNECLEMLKQLAPEDSGTLALFAQQLLKENNPLSSQDERKLQLILWTISTNDESTTIELISTILERNITSDLEAYVDILDNLNSPHTIPALISAIKLDSSVGVLGGMARSKAINALLLLNAKQAKSFIIPYVKDSVYRVRRAAIEFLFELDISEAAPVFIEQLNVEDVPDNIELLIDGIISWEQIEALPVLQDILSSNWIRNDEYLLEIVEDAISELQALKKPDITS